MAQVALDGRRRYVTALPAETWQLAEDRWLYRVADGYLGLHVHPIPSEEVTP